jgi:hypothetical protein
MQVNAGNRRYCIQENKLNFISFLIFIPLHLLFLPLGLVGVFMAAYKQIILSKRLGSSQTAIEVNNGRWTMHVFGIRKDDATEKIASALPNTSTSGLWLVLFPLWVPQTKKGHLL